MRNSYAILLLVSLHKFSRLLDEARKVSRENTSHPLDAQTRVGTIFLLFRLLRYQKIISSLFVFRGSIRGRLLYRKNTSNQVIFAANGKMAIQIIHSGYDPAN